MMTTIDPAVLALPVQGRHLRGPTLGEALGEAPRVLLFLRHFG